MAAENIIVGFAGTDGAYAHQAALSHFRSLGDKVTYRAFPTFKSMLMAVRGGDIQFAVLPIENTTAGSITEAYDLLTALELSLVGEEIQRIDHCLIGVSHVALAELRRIYSHPQALAQCSEFLESLTWCTAETFANTALAVKKIAEDGDPSHAAIASEEAARVFSLPILARNISNHSENLTRFVIVAAAPITCDPTGRCKTSVMFVTKHEKGALVACLNVLAERNLNLTKLESRPRPDSPWEYQFYVDFEGSSELPGVHEALTELRRRCMLLRVFGSYPVH